MNLPSRLRRRLDHERSLRDLESAFARVMAGAPRSVANRRRTVGVATFGGGEWHLVIELLLAHALQQRGARAELLICDLPDLPICTERLVNSIDQQRCAGCVEVKQTLLSMSGLAWTGISRFVSAATIERACRVAETIPAADIEGYRERGHPVGEWLHVSACHFLRCDARGDAVEKHQTRRRLLAAAIVAVAAMEGWLDALKPDVVLTQSGAHLFWRVARELANARGIPVVCRELGKGGWDRHIYALNRDCMAPDLDLEWASVRGVPLSHAEAREVDALASSLGADTFGPLRATGDALAVDRQKRVAVAFTNVTWDLASAGRDVAFDGVFDWLRATIDALADRSEVQLVIRAHPAEAGVMTRERICERIAREWPELGGSIIVVPPEHPVTARALIDQADLVLAYNSTAGLEAAMRGRPVMIGGAPHYRGRGFTIDIPRRAEYAKGLSDWANGARIEAPILASDLAQRYFHLFFARYHVTMGWTTSPLEPPYRLLIESFDALVQGRNASLDLVCDGILSGRQILRPAVNVEQP